MQSSDFFKIFLSPILKVRKRCAGNGGGAARIAAGQGCPSAFHAKEARGRPPRPGAPGVGLGGGGGRGEGAPGGERALGRNDPSRAKCRTPCAALLQQCVSGRGFVSGVQERYVPPAGPHPLRVTGFSFVFRRPKIELIAEKFVLLQN